MAGRFLGLLLEAYWSGEIFTRVHLILSFTCKPSLVNPKTQHHRTCTCNQLITQTNTPPCSFWSINVTRMMERIVSGQVTKIFTEMSFLLCRTSTSSISKSQPHHFLMHFIIIDYYLWMKFSVSFPCIVLILPLGRTLEDQCEREEWYSYDVKKNKIPCRSDYKASSE